MHVESQTPVDFHGGASTVAFLVDASQRNSRMETKLERLLSRRQ